MKCVALATAEEYKSSADCESASYIVAWSSGREDDYSLAVSSAYFLHCEAKFRNPFFRTSP